MGKIWFAEAGWKETLSGGIIKLGEGSRCLWRRVWGAQRVKKLIFWGCHEQSWMTALSHQLWDLLKVLSGGEMSYSSRRLTWRETRKNKKIKKLRPSSREGEFSFSNNWIICQYPVNQNTGNWNDLSPTTLHEGKFALIGGVFGGERLHVLKYDIL